ncbi:MAG TPA: hypothetical protein VMM78_14440 [Thermomicrobiales bacterium]|nr:hypothetical protein [Thermomicrobiales bacterium]
MLGKESLYAFACVLSGVVIAMGTFVALGGEPSPVLSLSMIVIGLGAALVVVRYGRLGPFQGAFGTPPVETAIRDRMRREIERATRYGHEFTVLALRQKSRRPRSMPSILRVVDDVIPCRRGVTLILLPETPSEGALRIHDRISEAMTEPTFAAIVSCPDDGTTTEELVAKLLTLIRSDAQPGDVVRYDRERDRPVADAMPRLQPL